MSEIKQEDLLKLKLDLLNADWMDRHDLKNLIQNNALDLEQYKQDQALIKQSQSTMQENIKEIKTDIKDWFCEIKNSFKGLDDKFATKEEHNANQKTINLMIKVLWTFATAVIIAGASFIWDKITNLI